MDTWEITIRLGAATLAGVALGLNRDLHHKPTGVRTPGLVGLGSAVAVVAEGDPGAVSRVVQGVVTGIGFLGAGVTMRTQRLGGPRTNHGGLRLAYGQYRRRLWRRRLASDPC